MGTQMIFKAIKVVLWVQWGQGVKGVRGPFLQFFSKLIVMRICAQWVGILQTGASGLELCPHNLTFNTFEYFFSSIFFLFEVFVF